MDYKTFVLLPHMDATAPIFQQLPEGQGRIRLTKIPRYRPFLQVTFTNEEGKNRTLRYKANSDKIWQDEQIKDGILANDKFTTNEYNDPWFYNGVKVTNKPTLVKFLLEHPACEGFNGICDDVREPQFKLVDKVGDIKTKNAEFNKRVDAAVKIKNITELKVAQDLLLRLNGTYFITPTDLAECKDLLIDFLDNAETAGLNAILKEDLNMDEKTQILIGTLINNKRLSFDAIDGSISKKSNDGKWISVRELSTTYSQEERIRLFSDFLNTEDGKALREDLERDLITVEKPVDNIKTAAAKK